MKKLKKRYEKKSTEKMEIEEDKGENVEEKPKKAKKITEAEK